MNEKKSVDTAAEIEKRNGVVRHTPGPWQAAESSHKQEWSHWIEAPDKTLLAAIANNNVNSQEQASCEANARLIAAAPELLEACKEALDALEGSKYGTDERLAAAIAKAEGKPCQN